MKYADLPHIDVLKLERFSERRLMRRQFPSRTRKHLHCEVREWENWPWVAVRLLDLTVPLDTWFGEHIRELIGSAPLLDKPKRFENQIVARATIDPELLVYVLLRL